MSDTQIDQILDQETQVEDNDSNEFSENESSNDSSHEGNSLKAAAAEVMKQLDPDSEEEDSEEDEVEEKQAKTKKKDEKSSSKSWKLKVGGKDVEIKDEQELIKRAQMGFSADEKWQEAAKIRKDMEHFVTVLQQDPGKALEAMGFDVDQLAEQHIARRIEEMQKSPEQLEKEKLQREIEELKRKETTREEQLRNAEMSRLQEQFAVQIENDISQALDSSKSLPKSPYVVKRIADALLLAMNNGYTDVNVKDVLPLVEQDIRNDIKDMFSVMPKDLIEAVVGKDVLNDLRKDRLKKARQAPIKHKVQPTGNSEIQRVEAKKNEGTKEKVVNSRDFFKNLGSY